MRCGHERNGISAELSGEFAKVNSQLIRARGMSMKATLLSGSLLFLVTLVFAPRGSDVVMVALGQEAAGAASVQSQQDLVNEYCVYCHNDALNEGGFSWTEIDLAHPEQNAEQTEKVIVKLRSGMMPPVGAPRPDAASLKALAGALETRIDQAASARPFVESPELHRVNRREYRNSVRDLLDLDIDIAALLPPDGRTGNFDNMADALTVTPALMQAYVRAADKIARQAVGDPQAPPVMAKFDVPKVANQMRHIEGTPFGTRGGTAVTHNFPADGEYTFALELYYYYTGELIGSNLPESLQGQQIEISIDGERVGVFTVDPLQEETTAVMVTDPITVTAGPHQVAAAFVSTFDGPVEDHYRLVEQTLMDISIGLQAGMTALPHLRTVTITGPMKITGVSETPSRRRIFSCHPTEAADEAACAEQIITRLASQAFRHPANPEDLESLMQLYGIGYDEGGFEAGVRTALQTILAKPEFVFRFERVPEDVQPGESYRIDDLELASRLSYFLWSTAPDGELIELARAQRLRDADVLEQQVARMLGDPRSETLSTDFASQWLRLVGIESLHPEPTIFPDFTVNLAKSMRREVELLFDSIVREDRDVLDLITADYTFVDETLARHYGIPDVLGNRFRRVSLDDPNRFGLLGKGGVLTMTSLSNRTSPVARGKYVLEVVVGAPPPAPPAVVPPFKESVNNEKVSTVRERMEAHRENPVCNACHQIMDPIGLALENFDAIGRWRANDSGLPIDSSSRLYDGTPLDGPIGLRKAILDRSEAVIGSFAENLLAYGVGRVLDYRDMPTVRSIARAAAGQENRFSAFVLGVVNSAPFQMRTLNPASEAVEADRQ